MNLTSYSQSVPELHATLEQESGSFHFLNRDKESVLLTNGKFNFNNLANGLFLHSCDHIELEDASSSVELEPCLSFNVLLEGRVKFSLGSQQYSIDADQGPVLFASIISENEVFTRFLSKSQRVVKVNVAAPKAWLEQRCTTTSDSQMLGRLFLQNKVMSLPLEPELLKFSRTVLLQNDKGNLQSSMLSEMLALQMFSQCMTALESQPEIKRISSQKIEKPISQCRIKQFIDQQIKSTTKLEDIARELGLSVSTLQRKFKQNHNVSVSHYIRNRRLDVAKRELVLEQLTIGEVAYNAGYNHVSNFNHAFKKRFKLAPAEYVKEHKAT